MAARGAASYLQLSNEVAVQLSRTGYTQSRVATGKQQRCFFGLVNREAGGMGEKYTGARERGQTSEKYTGRHLGGGVLDLVGCHVLGNLIQNAWQGPQKRSHVPVSVNGSVVLKEQ